MESSSSSSTISAAGLDPANVVSASLLIFACMHALSYASVYVMTLVKVIMVSEKSKPDKMPTRVVASIYLFFYLLYNVAIYTLVLSIVNWKGLFRESLWDGSIFDNEWSFILYYEPALLILTTWFKIACGTHSWITAPSEKTLIEEAKRAMRKGTKSRDQLPYVTVVMPIYNEPLTTLMTAINSVCEVEYPLDRIHLVLAFDDDKVSDIYRGVMYCLANGGKDKGKDAAAAAAASSGDIEMDMTYPLITDLVYRKLHVTPCRFVHGGKRHAQMCAYYYLDSKYTGIVQKPLLLFIDSDIQLDRFAINYFVHDLAYKGHGIRREALTGLITCKTAKTYNFWKVLQDTEYIESQMLHRNTEDYLGSVTCLPGALTMVRFESLKFVAATYFNQMDASDSLDFQRCHLGEDRYLTHLLMESRKTKYRIGFCPAAKCKTEGCEDFRSLMKQRRRWYLGTLANEIYMLTSPVLWRQFTALMTMATITSLKNGPLFIYVFVSEAIMGRATPLSLIYIALIFVPIWVFVIVYGIRLNRLKIVWCYPIILLLLPTMSACFQFYGMMTMSVRTWGGPRAEADSKEGDKPTQEGTHSAAAANTEVVLSVKLPDDSNEADRQRQSAAIQQHDRAQGVGFSPRNSASRSKAAVTAAASVSSPATRKRPSVANLSSISATNNPA